MFSICGLIVHNYVIIIMSLADGEVSKAIVQNWLAEEAAIVSDGQKLAARGWILLNIHVHNVNFGAYV